MVAASVGVSLLCGGVVLGGCQARRADTRRRPAPSAVRAEVLEAVGQCVLGTYRAAHEATRTLRDAVASAQADPSTARRAAARAAWVAAMAGWQEAEVMQLGPAASAALPGGQNLRDEIYSWPLTGRCLVEQQLVARGYEDPAFPTGLVNVRGLDALEYLLFYEGTDNACTASANVNSSGSWAALGAAELSARKSAYAVVAAEDLVVRSGRLVDAWDPARGDFLAQLRLAGAGSRTWSTDLAAVNSVTDALFYVEKQVKDMKVGRPLGVVDCVTPTCPEALESRYARRSKAHVRNNLVGFGKLIAGCGPDGAGLGLDDLLEASGSAELGKRVIAALAAAVAAVDAIDEDDLDLALAADPASVRGLHEALKALTDLLKDEVALVLGIELPANVEGDND